MTFTVLTLLFVVVVVVTLFPGHLSPTQQQPAFVTFAVEYVIRSASLILHAQPSSRGDFGQWQDISQLPLTISQAD